MKHRGSIHDLIDLLEGRDLHGYIDLDLDRPYQWRSQCGAIVNFWPSTGTVFIQGKRDAARHLERLLEPLLLQRRVADQQSNAEDEEEEEEEEDFDMDPAWDN